MELENQIHDAIKAILYGRKKETAFRIPTGFEPMRLHGRRGNPLRDRFGTLQDLFISWHSCIIRLEVICEGRVYAFATLEEFNSWRNSRENRRIVTESINILVTSS